MNFSSTILVLLALTVGCERNQPRISSSEEKTQLITLNQKSGLTFPPGIRLIHHGDGGGRDASHGFYNWTLFSSTEVSLPRMKENYIVKGYLELPLDNCIEVLKVTAKGEDFSDALMAISTDWETNGYGFTAMLVRTKHGDYVHITTAIIK